MSSNPAHSVQNCEKGCIGYVGFDLYLGSSEASGIPEILKAQNINYVLSIGPRKKGGSELKDICTVRHIQATHTEARGQSLKAQYDGVQNFLAEGTTGGNKTLVLCTEAEDDCLPATMIALHIIKHQKLTVLDVLLLILSVRLDIDMEPDFIDDLKDMEKEIGKEESFEDFNLPGSVKRPQNLEEVLNANVEFYKAHKTQVDALKNSKVKGCIESDVYRTHRFKGTYTRWQMKQFLVNQQYNTAHNAISKYN